MMRSIEAHTHTHTHEHTHSCCLSGDNNYSRQVLHFKTRNAALPSVAVPLNRMYGHITHMSLALEVDDGMQKELTKLSVAK